ncbi:MAG: hypothetical protein ACYDA9_01290 [Terriglobia bacterium]
MSHNTQPKSAARRRALQTMLGIGAGLAAPLQMLSKEAGFTAQLDPSAQTASPPYRRILTPYACHPALMSAAKILARKLAISENQIKSVPPHAIPKRGEIALANGPLRSSQHKLLGAQTDPAKYDGYVIGFREGAALVQGNRPRSLLYAAGDFMRWKDKTAGTFLREPSFQTRTSHGSRGRTIADVVAEVGANVMTGDPAVATLKGSFPNLYNLLSREDQDRLEKARSDAEERSKAVLQECRDADVPVYTSIYGNNFQRWSPALYAGVIKAYPSTQGTPMPNSWEKAPLCPSDSMTWKIINAYVRELMEQSGADGFLAIFWDQFGMYCQNDRCVKSGLNKFPNELFVNVKNLYETVNSMGKKLIVRTWSSGCPHWLGEEYVHAPGYGHFGGSGEELWARVIKELPADIILQTKVYDSDVEPDPPFSPLIGKVKPHTQIAEYQIIGQTTGRFYFPASQVNYNARTIKQALNLIGPTGGVNAGYGATMQADYSLLDDIVNGINIYAFRELSWNVNANLNQVWKDWAVPIYGAQAAPHIIRALQLSEDAANLTFSVLGMGSSTNSDFEGNIARKETLLRYTNRYYRPEYARYLEPNKENIDLVIQEKEKCLNGIEEMFKELELARPFLTKDQADELQTRFNWLKEFAICRKYLDISLWRYRYLRHLASMLTTEPEQMKFLAEAYDQINDHAKLLFQYEPEQKFSCYSVTLGKLPRQPSRAMGSPLPIMRQLYAESRKFVEDSVGPDYLPIDWRRG